jgi:hypothetical protein
MGMSAAERMRKYRAAMKADENRYSEYLSNERRRYRKRKSNGQIRLIDDCKDREKNLKRRKWRNERRERRKKQKMSEAMIKEASTVLGTPPNSPTPGPSNDDREKRGRKKVRRDRAQAYRQVQKLKIQLKQKSKEANKYRKRWKRLMDKQENNDVDKKGKLNKAKISQRRDYKRNEALFNSVIVKELRMKMMQLKSEKDRQILSKAVTGNILKKYNLLGFADRIGISQKRIRANRERDTAMTFNRKTYRNKIDKVLFVLLL